MWILLLQYFQYKANLWYFVTMISNIPYMLKQSVKLHEEKIINLWLDGMKRF